MIDVMEWTAQEAVKGSFYGKTDSMAKKEARSRQERVYLWLQKNPGVWTAREIQMGTGMTEAEVTGGLRTFPGKKGILRGPNNGKLRTYEWDWGKKKPGFPG